MSISWCECAKCTAIPSGIECQCCIEIEDVSKYLADNVKYSCITEYEQFRVLCLNKDVLFTALIMMNTIGGDLLNLPLPNRYAAVKL